MAEESIGIWEAPEIFRESALRHFHFLTAEFGFQITDDRGTPFIVFASPSLQVVVYYEAERRHELDVRLGRIGADALDHDVYALQAAQGLDVLPLDDIAGRSHFPETQQQLDDALALRAHQLRLIAGKVLSGDMTALERAAARAKASWPTT